MQRLLTAFLLCVLLVPGVVPAQEPDPQPQEPPDEVEPQEPGPGEQEPDEAPADESTADESEPQEDLEPLTPKQEEAKRKAAERAAKREARKVRRADKKDLQEAKQVEKDERQAANRSAKAAEEVDLGHAAIEAGKYKAAVDHFNKAKELEGGRSFAGEMGLARTELAQGNSAQAVRLAQRAVQSTPMATEKAEALTLAGDATLAARPLIDGDPDRPQPGTEMFADTAMRFYVRALEFAPAEATAARAALDRRFEPLQPSSRTTRLLDYYLGNVAGGKRKHGSRVAATYETLLSGQIPETPLAVVGPVSAPKWKAGRWPRLGAGAQADGYPRPIVALVIEPDGSVASVELLNGGDDEARDRAVVEAMESWTWEPARLPDGRAVRVHWLHFVEVQPE